MKIIKNKNGITLVALIITIIIMLILAGIMIADINGNGIIGKAKESVSLYQNSANDENSINLYFQSICEHSYEDGVCTKCGKEKATFTWKQTGTEPTIEVNEDEKLKNYKIYGNEMLPDGYQELEYIESTGTQYINTGVKPSQSTYFGIDFAMTPTSFQKTSEGKYNYFYGANSTNRWLSFECSAGQAYWNIGDVTYVQKHNMSINNKYEYSIRYNSNDSQNKLFTATISVNENSRVNVSNAYTGSFGDNENLIFFKDSVNGTAFSSEKLYYLKLYLENEQNLVRDFIPCYSKSEDKAGLYDLVNNIFYSNNGTDKFTTGGNVFSNVGDLVTNTSDANYNKYKISVAVTNGENTDTYDIYLDEPLRRLGESVDYIDFKNSKVVRNVQLIEEGGEEKLQALDVPEETAISLPEITLKSGSNTITIQTKVKPSDVEIVYY